MKPEEVPVGSVWAENMSPKRTIKVIAKSSGRLRRLECVSSGTVFLDSKYLKSWYTRIIEVTPDPITAVAKVKPEQQTAVAEAQAIIYGNREEIYGPPGENLDRTAQIWSVIFGVPVSAEQVCWAMVGLKMAREVNAIKRDNLVDALGYLMLIDRIREVPV